MGILASEQTVQEAVLDAFAMADAFHEEHSNTSEPPASDNSGSTDIEELVGETEEDVGEAQSEFDPRVLEEAMKPLYRGAQCTELAATIMLMNVCIVYRVSNSFAHELFALLYHHLLPIENSLPKSYYATKSMTSKLGLAYTAIHACERGCVLFRHEHADAIWCLKCSSPRYKDEVCKMFLVKVLRHFPIIPCFQRLFCSPCISKHMLWHAENRSDREGGDKLVWHPCDSKAWRHFWKNVGPIFEEDLHNVHFALAADGVNPFKQTRSTWSTWLVTLLNYNLPLWLSTKKFFILLALLIPGKDSVTSDNFDIYMEPLVEELLQL
jgi:hypothetical protein